MAKQDRVPNKTYDDVLIVVGYQDLFTQSVQQNVKNGWIPLYDTFRIEKPSGEPPVCALIMVKDDLPVPPGPP